MSAKEKEILSQAVERGGLLSPADLISGIAQGDRKSVENLVAKGYLEEVAQAIDTVKMGSAKSVNFYRVSAKGLMVFEPWHVRFWELIRGDTRTIIVSIITAILVTLIAICMESKLGIK